MPERFGAAIVLALLLASPLRSASAEPVDPTPAFIVELQAAIRNEDKDWLADHLHLPVNYFGKTKQVIDTARTGSSSTSRPSSAQN